MADWKFYHHGVYGSAAEHELRAFTERLRVFIDDKGVAAVVMRQMWEEIDRLREALSDARLAMRDFGWHLAAASGEDRADEAQAAYDRLDAAWEATNAR